MLQITDKGLKHINNKSGHLKMAVFCFPEVFKSLSILSPFRAWVH